MSGQDVKPWAGRAVTVALQRVKARGVRDNLPCCLCGQPIDYRLTYPNRWSCTVQHVKARAYHPELTWDPSNWAPAHLQCNLDAPKGRPADPPDLGVVDAW